MSRSHVRALFLVGAALGAVALAGGALVALRPATLSPFAPSDVAVAKLSALAEGVPTEVDVKALAGLERKAWDMRTKPYTLTLQPHHPDALPVYLVRSDGTVRAFIGLDPRNGCRLDTTMVIRDSRAPGVVVLHDVCHGSLYDLSGEKVGGPTPWSLDELVVNLRGDLVYIDRGAVKPGRLLR